MNIEKKIRLKAAGLYVITGVVMIMLILFLYRSRKNINNQRFEIENLQHVLTLTNELISKVSDTQSEINNIIVTYDTLYLEQVNRDIKSINRIIDTLSIAVPGNKAKLLSIKDLLYNQTQNIATLSQQLNNENPIDQINDNIKNYNQKNIKTSNSVEKKDSVFASKPKEKKSFFSKITGIFSSSKKKEQKKNQQTEYEDTLRTKITAQVQHLANIEQMAMSASEEYDSNINEIRREVAEQIATDKEISSRIARLLLDFHTQTLNSVLTTIEKSEQQLNRNYIFSFVGGIVALLLILLFILLIIYDVNKGKEAREKLRLVMENRHQLLLSISHDIKSPLSSIMGYLELSKKEGEDIKSMQNSARHILALLENLLEFSSLEQGSLTSTSSPFQLNNLTDEIEQMFIPMARNKGIDLKVSSSTVRIYSDQMKIKQIIINLVSNALKYTTDGSVNLSTIYAENVLQIQVKDTGAGIPEDKLDAIFKPFSRVESNNNLAHGSGLGLYVVKGLTELLNGNIEVTSQVQMGTTFTVVIPCETIQSEIKKDIKRIKVYDDDELFLRMTCDMLKQLGHKIVDTDFDIVLTDMEMGEISGLDILKYAGNVPVVVMTGDSGFTTEKAISLGFDAFLPKPFSTDSLREIFGEGESSQDSFLEEDDDEIRELFKANTAENFKQLRQAVADADFNKARTICHKMQPMFVLLGYPTDAMKRMNANKNHPYTDWQKDVESILSIKV